MPSLKVKVSIFKYTETLAKQIQRTRKMPVKPLTVYQVINFIEEPRSSEFQKKAQPALKAIATRHIVQLYLSARCCQASSQSPFEIKARSLCFTRTLHFPPANEYRPLTSPSNIPYNNSLYLQVHLTITQNHDL